MKKAPTAAWVKVNLTYNRANAEQRHTTALIQVANIRAKEAVENALLDYFASWTGTGYCTVQSVKAGPFAAAEVSNKIKRGFSGRVYRFAR